VRVIGVTGGIASGKSMVAQILREFGAEVIDADLVGHEIMEPGLPAYNEVVGHFGREILDNSGRVSRRVLGNIVFSDPKQLEALNRITHPRIYEGIKEMVVGLRQSQVCDLVVIEAALLFEIGLDRLVDEVWTVEAHPTVQVERLMQRNNITEEQALQRICAQLPSEERISRADRVILNNDGQEALVRQIVAIMDCT